MMANKKRIAVAAVCLVAVMALSFGVAAAHQSMDRADSNNVDNNILTRAALIDDENSKFIGKEIHDDTPLTATKGIQEKPYVIHDIETNGIVSLLADGVLPPDNITSFETADNVTPEVIVPNGSAAIFGQPNDAGWMCNDGDELVYQFEKYPSEVGDQTLVVGYILDGVMYPGEKFLEANGEYRLGIEKTGEYFIYVINASSDPLALKGGNVQFY